MNGDLNPDVQATRWRRGRGRGTIRSYGCGGRVEEGYIHALDETNTTHLKNY